MATYGSGQMLGSGINPESFKQDYSGFTRAAEMQAQGITGLGKSISGVIDNFGEAKKEQKKVDAYNKASAKSIEAAITLGNSYEIAGAEETLRPFLDAYNDPNLSPIEKAALLDEGKAMIPNVFGRFDQSQANAIQKAQVDARNAPPPRSFDFKEVAVPHVVNGVKGTIRMLEDANSGRVRTSDGKEYSNIEDAKAGRNPIGQVNSGIDAALNLPIPPLTGNLNRDATAINNAQQLPSVNEMDNTPAIMLTGGMPDGQENLANALPVPVGSPTVTQQPKVDGPPGFIPDEPKEQVIIVNQEQLNNLVAQGAKVDFLPRGDGTYIVSGTTIGGKPLVEVNTAESTQQERAKAMDKFLFDERAKLQGAVANKDSIKKMISLIDEGVKTGFSQDVIMQFNRAFGKDVSDSETFKSVSGNVAMGFINLTKGAISDREMTYFTTVLAPNLGNTPEGNRKIGEFMLKAVEKAEKIEKVISEGMRNGKSSFDIDDEVRKIKNVDTLLPSDASTTANPSSVNEFASTPEEDALVEEFKSKNK